MDPVELRIKNAHVARHATCRPGQVVPAPRRSPSCWRSCAPCRSRRTPTAAATSASCPAAPANTTTAQNVVRGVGYAVGFKNVGFSEGFDDYSTARVRLELDADGEPIAEVHTAAAEVGQGVITVQAQIARTELGVERVIVRQRRHPGRLGRLHSRRRGRPMSPAARCKAACEAVRERWQRPRRAAAAASSSRRPSSRRHKPTYKLDENGQGDAHFQFAFSAHRAVVDVDEELGLVRVVELATPRRSARRMNPQAL